jgi:signal transduction histidine kinase
MTQRWQGIKLDDLDRDQLLATVRRLLVEADALSTRIAAVNEISIAINRTLNLKTILYTVSKQAKWLMDFDHLSVYLRDATGAWELNTLFGQPLPEAITTHPLITEPRQTRQARLLHAPQLPEALSDYHGLILIPLTSEDQALGTIQFASRRHRYNQDDLRIAYMLALELSSAIRNAMLYNELEKKEQELRRRAAELEEMNRQLDLYNHAIAHDLKSPLAGIMMSAQFIERVARDALPERAQDHLQLIEQTGQKMTQMLNQLLFLAKLQNALDSLVPIQMNAVVDAVLLRYAVQIAHRPIQIIVQPDLPVAMGHGLWVEEIMANLIGNALKYMGDDNRAPCIHVHGEVRGLYAYFRVCDNGIGIAPEHYAGLFDIFTRVNTADQDGTGLGLSIVKRMVTKIGGDVGVESAVGKGSTFWFTLPLPADAPDYPQPAATASIP